MATGPKNRVENSPICISSQTLPDLSTQWDGNKPHCPAAETPQGLWLEAADVAFLGIVACFFQVPTYLRVYFQA